MNKRNLSLPKNIPIIITQKHLLKSLFIQKFNKVNLHEDQEVDREVEADQGVDQGVEVVALVKRKTSCDTNRFFKLVCFQCFPICILVFIKKYYNLQDGLTNVLL